MKCDVYYGIKHLDKQREEAKVRLEKAGRN